MRVLLAPDKFKGSLRAGEVAAELAAGLQKVDPTIEIVTVPVADGGDGTLDAALSAGFERIAVDASGPTGQPRRASFGRRGDTAVVELAGICGLALLGADLDPLGATSLGCGQVIAAALDAGVEHIILGIGGSASTDGGAGLLTALGARLLDAQGCPIGLGGGRLADLDRLDVTELHPRLGPVELLVASDVDNPLCGPRGAAAVYGPQKGATAAEIDQLEANLVHFASLVEAVIGTDHSGEPGAGAAGGVGFGALVLGGRLRSGVELVLELVDFGSALVGVDLVITGEGSLDEQSLAGKAPVGVAVAARARGIPVLVVAGRTGLSPAQLAAVGITRVYALSELEPDLAASMANAGSLVRQVGAMIGADLHRFVPVRATEGAE